MDDRVARLQGHPGGAEAAAVVEEVEEPEDPLELLAHGGAEALPDRLGALAGRRERAQDLVRAVVAEDLGAERGLEGAGVDRHVGPLVPHAGERDEDPQAEAGVAVEQVVGQDGGGLVGADPLEHGREGAPHGGRGPRVGEDLGGRAEGRLARRDERVRRARRERRVGEPGQEGADERPRPVPGGGADRGARHLVVLVRDQPAQGVREGQGLALREPGRLEAGPPPLRALLRHHGLEEGPGSLQAVVAEAGQHRHHRGAHGEVGVVPEVLQAGERVHVGVAREVEQRLRAHLQVGVVQQGLGLRDHRAVARPRS